MCNAEAVLPSHRLGFTARQSTGPANMQVITKRFMHVFAYTKSFDI